MESSGEKIVSQPQPFSLEMLEYFSGESMTDLTPFEHVIEGTAMGPLMARGRQPIPTQQEMEKILKIDTISEKVTPGTHMKLEKDMYERELKATEEDISLRFEFTGGERKGKISQLHWSQPAVIDGVKKFTRFESVTTIPERDSVEGGTLKLFYDVPNGGTKRFQYLLTLNGSFSEKQKIPFIAETLGGIFNPAGQILQPGSYYLTDEK